MLDGREISSIKELYKNKEVIIGIGDKSCLSSDIRRLSANLHRKLTPRCADLCFLLTSAEIEVSLFTKVLEVTEVDL